MGLILSIAGRLAGRSGWLTRLAERLLANPLRLVKGKPVERQLLVYQLPDTQLALANDLRVADTVLSDRAGTFPKAKALERLLHPLIGAGVFGQPGGNSVRQTRRIYLRALAQVPEDRIAAIARDLTRHYLADWAASGHPVPVPSELSRLTVDVVSEATLGDRFSPAESRRFVELFFEYHRRARPLVLLLGSQDAAAQDALVRRMDLSGIAAEMRGLMRQRFLAPLLEDARADDGRAPFAAALVEALAAAAGSSGSDRAEAMLDEIAVMLLAGHETTASVLSWLFWELAAAPEWQDRAAAALAGAAAGGETADASRVLEALSQEALRLYPPIAFLLRQTTEAVSFRERPLVAGAHVAISPWTIQRHRALWSDPDRFDPGRWLAPEPPAATAERLALLPFGYGPRVCPGKRFAEVEMRAILGEVLASWRLARPRSRGRAPVPLGSLTSRPDRDFPLVVVPRGAG